jgi:glutamate racemase
VIATQATFQGELFASLLERYAGDVEVLTQVCPGLVDAVEAGALEAPETDALLQACLAPLIEAGIDQLVLGCTHYPFLQSAIERILGDGIAVIDPAPAVARQTGRVLAQRGLGGGRDTAGHHRFYTTGDVAAFKEMIERLLPARGDQGEVRQATWRGRSLRG